MSPIRKSTPISNYDIPMKNSTLIGISDIPMKKSTLNCIFHVSNKKLHCRYYISPCNEGFNCNCYSPLSHGENSYKQYIPPWLACNNASVNWLTHLDITLQRFLGFCYVTFLERTQPKQGMTCARTKTWRKC